MLGQPLLLVTLYRALQSLLSKTIELVTLNIIFSVESGLEFQQGLCTFIIVVRYPATYL